MSQGNSGENTAKRAETSRRNGVKSKGPITREGKKRSRGNATKHGLLTKDLIIPNVESPEEFAGLLSELVADLGPSGKLESLLVEEIAISFWRLRRAVKAETNQVQLQRISRPILFKRNRKALLDIEVSRLGTPTSSALIESTLPGVYSSLLLLDLITKEAESTGYLQDDSQLQLRRAFAHNSYFVEHVWLHNQAEKPAHLRRDRLDFRGNVISESETSIFDEHKKNCPLTLVALLRLEIQYLEEHLDDVRLLQRAEGAFGENAQTIPESVHMDKILRYETAIKRQLYRALDQLERLQRRRRGEYVPPPMKVGIQQEG